LLFASTETPLVATSWSEPLVIAIDRSWRFVYARFDPKKRTPTPRLETILAAVERGAVLEFTELGGRSAVRVLHPDGSKQISVLADDERTFLEELQTKR
jgi:hypothetical protein